MPKYYAAVEGGGTSFRAAVAADVPTAIVARQQFVTRDPATTLAEVAAWLAAESAARGGFAGLGVASFGPVELDPSSPRYGYITTTPKAGWQMTDVLGPLRRAVGAEVPFAFDTDVNAPAVAEHRYHAERGAGVGETGVAYITVGTGIGVGLVVNGKPVHGRMHPEAGHIKVARPAGATFAGTCPFHGDCVEGLASSGAIAAATGVPRDRLKEVPDDHPVWDTVAHALGGLCASLVLVASPERIVLSGGVMNRASLFPKVRRAMLASLGGYVSDPAFLEEGPELDDFLGPSLWGDDAGLIGALALATGDPGGGGGGGGGRFRWATAAAAAAAAAAGVAVVLARRRR